MIETPEELAPLVAGTLLEGRETAALPVLDTGETALAVDIEVADIETAWRAARSLLDRTGRWPLVTMDWGSDSGNFEERIAGSDFFSRFYYEEAPDASDVSPRGIIEKSHGIDAADFIKRLTQDRAEEAGECEIDDELEGCAEEVGRRPKDAELDDSIPDPLLRIEHWLHGQLVAAGRIPEPTPGYTAWFDPPSAVLMLLPTASGWESLAYQHFYGAYQGSEYYIAVGKSWEERFGAELVCHYGTMLQCLVKSPPQEPADAWQLAMEHDLYAECTLAPAGIRVRDHAFELIGNDRWFLHDRP